MILTGTPNTTAAVPNVTTIPEVIRNLSGEYPGPYPLPPYIGANPGGNTCFDERPLVGGLVMVIVAVGLWCNIYMLMLQQRKTKTTRSSRVAEFCFEHIAISDIVTLSVLPIWLHRTLLKGGWLLGRATCKTLRMMTTVSFQYGVCVLIYITVVKYNKIVRNPMSCQSSQNTNSRRWKLKLVSICVAYPAAVGLLDGIMWDVVPLGAREGCHNSMIQYSYAAYEAMGWLKIVTTYILPVIVIMFANIMIAKSIREHMAKFNNKQRNRTKRAALLPILTMCFFVVCWTPLVISAVYWKINQVNCNVSAIMNICTVLGHMYCVTNPLVYIYMYKAKQRDQQSLTSESGCSQMSPHPKLRSLLGRMNGSIRPADGS